MFDFFQFSEFVGFSVLFAVLALAPLFLIRNLIGLSLACGMLFCSISLMTTVLQVELKAYSNPNHMTVSEPTSQIVTGSVQTSKNDPLEDDEKQNLIKQLSSISDKLSKQKIEHLISIANEIDGK